MIENKSKYEVQPSDFNIKRQVSLIDLDKTMKDNHDVQLLNEEMFRRAIAR